MDTPSLEEALDLATLRAEAMGWVPLSQGAYLHQGAAPQSPQELVIEVVGVPDANMAGLNVLLLI